MGVSNEAQLDQKTLSLCLSEVQACKEQMHPNFLIMLGDRYGWVSLPYAIEKVEFEEILQHTSNDEELKEWYKLDENQLPASYILKERKDAYREYENWVKVENQLRDILQKAVNLSNITDEQKRKYFFSATEAEVEEGIIPYLKHTEYQEKHLLRKNPQLKEIDAKHIFAFLRDIDKSTKDGDKFFTNDYEEAQSFKNRVLDNIVEQNILKTTTKQIDKENLDEKYLQEFEARVLDFLKAQIDLQKQQENKKHHTPLQEEKIAQESYATQKKVNFIAQEEMLKAIQEYIDGTNNQALVLYGKSGSGKSALIAKAIEETKAKNTKKVLFRFVGATPHSSYSKEILTSLFEELGIDVKEKEDLKASDNTKYESFEDFSYRIYDEFQKITEDIVIFIDALDQLQNEDNFLWLSQKLPKNIKIVMSALEDENYEDDTTYFNTLKNGITNNLYKIADFSQPKQLLELLLKEHNRTITPTQENYFLKLYSKVNSPLYITIAVQELKGWKSTDTTQTLADTQSGIISEFISNLSEFYHHDKRFVQKVLGYIYASRDGLSENELLQLLNEDKEFVKMMADERYHKNHTQELPLVHWSRLQLQLKPFLSSKTIDGEELMYFFHREFEDAIKKQPYQKQEHQEIITTVQKLIAKNQDKKYDANRWGNLYINLITEYQLRYNDKEKHKEFSEFLADNLLTDEWVEEASKIINSVGFEHNELNRTDKAIAYFESRKYSSEKLYQQNPQRWAEDYTGSLNGLAFFYKSVDRVKEAIELQELALKITKELYQQNSQRWAEDYTRSLNNLASSYSSIDRVKEAIELEELALKITKELYQQNPQRWAELYTTSLNNLAYSYKSVDRVKEAIELEELALKIRKELYQQNPQRWAELYTTSLYNLAISYYKINNLEKAIELFSINLKIHREYYGDNDEKTKEVLENITFLENKFKK